MARRATFALLTSLSLIAGAATCGQRRDADERLGRAEQREEVGPGGASSGGAGGNGGAIVAGAGGMGAQRCERNHDCPLGNVCRHPDGSILFFRNVQRGIEENDGTCSPGCLGCFGGDGPAVPDCDGDGFCDDEDLSETQGCPDGSVCAEKARDPAGNFIDRTPGDICVPGECNVNGDCPTDKECVQGQCKAPKPDADGDCPRGWVKTDDGNCKRGCDNDADCRYRYNLQCDGSLMSTWSKCFLASHVCGSDIAYPCQATCIGGQGEYVTDSDTACRFSAKRAERQLRCTLPSEDACVGKPVGTIVAGTCQ